jgi:hypothetical protein
VLAVAGVLSGTAFAQLPGPVPVPTVTVPTVTLPPAPVPVPTVTVPPTPVPVPTVPVPPPPTVTVPPAPVPTPTVTVPPAPTPTVATPTVATPTVSTPRPATPSTPSVSTPSLSTPSLSSAAATGAGSAGGAAGSGGFAGSAGSVGGATGSSSTGAAAWQPSASARTAGPTRKLGALRIRFTLPRRAEVLIVLRGPLPSCEVRGQRRLDAKSGTNAVRLTKIIRPRRALPGHYLVTVYVGSVPKVRKVVRITGKRAQLLGTAAIAEALALCTARSGAAVAFVDGPDGASGTGGTLPATIEKPGIAQPVVGPPEDAPAKVLSFLDVESADTLSPVLAVLIGMALGALLLAGLGGMAAFIRGRARSA